MLRGLALTLLTMIFFCCLHCHAQKATVEDTNFTFGVGAGIDYGGFGARATLMAHKNIGIFGAVGHNLVTIGYNAGAYYRFLPEKRASPTLGAMYGYNAAMSGDNYYGISLSAGVQLKAKKNPSNFFNLEIVLPVRSSEFEEDYRDSNDKIYPVLLSVGYHFGAY